MSPTATGLFDWALKIVMLLGAGWATLRFFGAPLLTQSIRTALAPELAKLAAMEREVARLREEHDEHSRGALTRRADLDRRVGSHETALAQLPAIRATLDHLTGEVGRANSLNERAMAGIQELAVQVGRLQGAWDAQRGTA